MKCNFGMNPMPQMYIQMRERDACTVTQATNDKLIK